MGRVAYRQAHRLMDRLVEARRRDEIEDVLLTVEHPPVITLGRGGGIEDLRVSVGHLRQRGIDLVQTERGGRATYHGPGQLVAYPILKLKDNDLHGYLWLLEQAAIETLSEWGIKGERLEEHPGVWVGSNKIVAVGVAVQHRVASHGIAINVDPDMADYSHIVPCGLADRGVTSLREVLDRHVPTDKVEESFLKAFARVFDREVSHRRDPGPWLATSVFPNRTAHIERLVDRLNLHTVCQAALCPNIEDCWARGTAAFMLLGDTCTRGCRFCHVTPGRPSPPDSSEPSRVAEAAAGLNLQHVVITSVTRDDLADGGAAHFAETIRAIRNRLPGAVIEVLVPDFCGSLRALEVVAAARPDILNHNVETVARLTPLVRASASYRRSLGVLRWARGRGLVTKSGFMVGLGETCGEVIDTMRDLRWMGVSILTIGQYLQPTSRQLEVSDYVHPALFEWYREIAETMGFRKVVSAPLVRSSYHADEMWDAQTS